MTSVNGDWEDKRTDVRTSMENNSEQRQAPSTGGFRIPENWADAPVFIPQRIKNWIDAPEFVPRTVPAVISTPIPAFITIPTARVMNTSSPIRLRNALNFQPVDYLDMETNDDGENARQGQASSVQDIRNEWRTRGLPNKLCRVVRTRAPLLPTPSKSERGLRSLMAEEQLCPFGIFGECRYGETCLLVHGDLCDFCGKFALHPTCTDQREKHRRECLEQHKKDMELSFAIAESLDKKCGICLELIVEKEHIGEQRFGILPACTHCFCLTCIRTWRQARHFETRIYRTCPECRVSSDFVCPSRYWMSTPEDKERLISDYKKAMSIKRCRYYNGGIGFCPFGNKCFYEHKVDSSRTTALSSPTRSSTETDAPAGDTRPTARPNNSRTSGQLFSEFEHSPELPSLQ